ncbi:MAG TPA: alpha/beta fold hydrolase [Pseudogracilibacillus sp.]|nr:alpha/beta fold hydrolase [Pseudogracilibacillus sp.]
MQIKKPEPFTFEAGPRAVLLLHGFTGHSADVRMIGRYLETKGYTSHAPIYRGHGSTPEDLLTASPEDWWEDVQQAYEHLQNLGYKEIAVAGLSLGGVLGLKLANCYNVKALVTMCSPMFFDNRTQLTIGFEQFARQYKQLERKDEATIEREVRELLDKSKTLFTDMKHFTDDISKEIDMVYAPILIVQARKDAMINPLSANYIYDHIASYDKTLKWYEESGHAITFDKEKDKLHEDIYSFLEAQDWEQ